MESAAAAGGCRLSGGSGAEGPPGGITLEELEGLDAAPAEQEDEGEAGPELEQERLLGFWQRVGRGHRVDVPPDMAQPIQQLTRNNHSQERESVPFTVISRKEKLGEVLFEKRHYQKGKWACVKVQEKKYEQSVCLGFMKIMRYICEQNSAGLYLGMTVPIVTIIHTSESASDIAGFVTVAYYLPGGLQDQPPEPLDPDIIIEEWPPAVVFARKRFKGLSYMNSSRAWFHFVEEAYCQCPYYEGIYGNTQKLKRSGGTADSMKACYQFDPSCSAA